MSSEFADVEQFLAEHGVVDTPEPNEESIPEEWTEREAAEVLAATWKNRRQELNRLQKSRKFDQMKDVKRAFRVEVEEVRRRSKCWKCNKLGHYARECRSKGPAVAASSSSASTREQGASSVEHVSQEWQEHFVCVSEHLPVSTEENTATSQEVLLVSSPGYAVIDSGCGKTIVGEETLDGFRKIWHQKGIPVKPELKETNSFRYGNGAQEVSHRLVEMPIHLAGKNGVVRAAVVKGKAPLLLSRTALKTMKAEMSFNRDELRLFDTATVPMETNEAGQYVIDVSKFDANYATSANTAEPSSADVSSECNSVQYNRHRDKVKDYWEVRPKDRMVAHHHLRPRRSKFTPCHTQCPVAISDLQSHRHTIIERPSTPEEQQCDQWTDGSHAHEIVTGPLWTGRTVFLVHPEVDLTSFCFQSDTEVSLMQWSPKQHRQLLAQLKERHAPRESDPSYHVIEAFSPPRFALECSKQGWKCLSADLCTGWDFRKIADRNKMKSIIEESPPDLLVLCPPCTWAGGWFHLNRHKMNPEEVREKERLTHLFINFCSELIDIQLKHGKRVLFEHPKSSIAWHLLKRHLVNMIPVDLHMCRYRMMLPGGELIRKPTRLLVSHSDMQVLAKTCPGPNDQRHRTHQSIAGSHPDVGSVSKFAGQYPPAFVKAVLDTVKELPKSDVLIVQDASAECLVASRLDDINAEDANQVMTSIKKLHQNLGHPPNNQLVRVLQHGGASSEAIRCAREFKCSHCEAQVRPRPALPGQTHRVTEFNALIGVDIKYLNGWKTNQKVPAVNIIDYASSLQVVVPLFQSVTSSRQSSWSDG